MYALYQTLWGAVISAVQDKIYSDTVRDTVTGHRDGNNALAQRDSLIAAR